MTKFKVTRERMDGAGQEEVTLCTKHLKGSLTELVKAERTGEGECSDCKEASDNGFFAGMDRG